MYVFVGSCVIMYLFMQVGFPDYVYTCIQDEGPNFKQERLNPSIQGKLGVGL